ncbi:hypothetical protein D3C57_143660 [Streptomyces rapamycinicus NRRL 5491]|uniref:Uncharacterized protein n=2 Tax=Streptomyces rapamycinicus TaxID=1226757 RepID=A0A3L8R9A2_STRRN|nr:hypothetical protein D3C57_143660 [Streptomyces rapamycinicus NRRL 5491]
MGVEFPAALAAWYRLCDGFGEGHGCGILPSGMAMLPLADLVDEYRMRTRDWVRSLGLVSVVVRVGGGVLGLGCVWAGQWWFVGGWVAVMR